MKLLFDETLPKRLQQDFIDAGFSVNSVQVMGWSGKKNGELLKLLVTHAFDALLTGDKNLAYQQSNLSVAIVFCDVQRLIYDAIKPLVPQTVLLLANRPRLGIYKIQA